MSGAIESNLSSLLEAERKVLVIMGSREGKKPFCPPLAYSGGTSSRRGLFWEHLTSGLV